MNILHTFSESKFLAEISISSIVIDSLPINPEGFATAIAIKQGVAMPPILVTKKLDGSYVLRDGRHRVIGHKLNGLKTIKAIISIEKKV